MNELAENKRRWPSELPDSVHVSVKVNKFGLNFWLVKYDGLKWAFLRTISLSFLSEIEHDKELTRFCVTQTMLVLVEVYFKRFGG